MMNQVRMEEIRIMVQEIKDILEDITEPKRRKGWYTSNYRFKDENGFVYLNGAKPEEQEVNYPKLTLNICRYLSEKGKISDSEKDEYVQSLWESLNPNWRMAW